MLSPPHAALLKIWYIVFFVWTSIGAYASIQYNFMVGSLGFSTEEALVPGFFGQGAAIVGALIASVRNQPRFRVCVWVCGVFVCPISFPRKKADHLPRQARVKQTTEAHPLAPRRRTPIGFHTGNAPEARRLERPLLVYDRGNIQLPAHRAGWALGDLRVVCVVLALLRVHGARLHYG
eukprot:COSAG06_NODE_853_length_11950_cov_3.644249_9_plen_178_part_00